MPPMRSHGEVRVRKCRAMVQALHSAGLGVVMDVVYNRHLLFLQLAGTHGARLLEPPVGKREPDQRLRLRVATLPASARWCASIWWIPVCTGPKSTILTGSAFDLMALHDVETMNAIRAALDALPGGEYPHVR